METISYFYQFGNLVTELRKKKKMNQVQFYDYLYPDNGKTDENKKKIMNAIENGKYKTLDRDFFMKICITFDISADYALGMRNDYSNYDIKFICEYTGLEEPVVKQLHKLNMDKNNGADISKLDEAIVGEDADEIYHRMRDKHDAIRLLKIINSLFKEGTWKNPKKKGRKEPYSNMTIFTALSMLCMTKAETMMAYPSMERMTDEEKLFHLSRDQQHVSPVYLDAGECMMLEDSDKVWHFVKPKDLIDQYARRMLNESVERMIVLLKTEETEKTV